MKSKWKNSTGLFSTIRNLFSNDKTVRIPSGGAALIFEDHRQIQTLINGLADADTWTGYNYSEKALSGTTIIKN